MGQLGLVMNFELGRRGHVGGTLKKAERRNLKTELSKSENRDPF